jgi:outer membrane cobalamin receptor
MVSEFFRDQLLAGALISVVGLASLVPSATQVDTTSHPVYHLDEVVAVADRTGSAIRETVAATSLLTREDIEALPAETLSQVLRHVPGLVFVERDGSGRLPMAVVRGFFGGGETSYVLLTVDGVPVNDERTGLVEWTQIPLSEIQRIEVLRGSAWVMYGDAAPGAVVNVVTRGSLARPEREVSVWGGSWGGRGFQGRVNRPVGAGWVDASLHFDGTDGYRSHSGL